MNSNDQKIQSAFSNMAKLCSRSEKSEYDIQQKLKFYELNEDDIFDIIEQLKAENFINEERYAVAFVNDKFKFNKWGRVKIAHYLQQKGIGSTAIDKALNTIDEKLYQNTLEDILEKKLKTIKQSDYYQQKAALIRFAQSRGYELNFIYSALKNILVP